MLPNSEIREVTLQDYLKILKKRYWILVAVVFIIPVSVLIFNLMQVPLYRATTSIFIDIASPSKVKSLDQFNVYEQKSTTEDQAIILNSFALAEQVFNSLRLMQDADFKNLESPVNKLMKMIAVSTQPKSKVLTVSVVDTEPLRASLIANTLVEVYLKRDVETRNQSLREAGQWLQDQLEDIRKKSTEAEKAVSEYSKKYKIVTGANAATEQEELLKGLRQEKADLETKIAEASRRYKDKHPQMIALRASLVDLDNRISGEAKNLSVLKDKLVQYNILLKDAESYQQLYNTMLQRTKDVGVSEKIEGSGIRVLDKAYPPQKPFRPKTQKDVITSIFLSFLLGYGLILFIEYLDSSMRSAEDVSSYLDLPFLGYIPSCDDKEAKSDSEKSLICAQNNTSVITESFRAVRTSILFSFPEDKPLKTIMVTSSLPQEGKSFIALNLALIFCQLNERVLLIDADMRKPKINKSFNFELKPGLSTILTGNIDFEKAIKATHIPNLSVITSGMIPPNPTELLHSQKLSTFIEEMQSRFMRVIIDCPPLLVGVDSALVANKVNGVIFVIKGGSTRLPDLIVAKKKLLDAKASIVGAIINNLAPERKDKYYYYHYSYKEEDGGKKKS